LLSLDGRGARPHTSNYKSAPKMASEILFCGAFPVKRAPVNFFRSVQMASDWLHGRFQESGAISHSLAGFAHLS
jgi:hypothetical protein